jgi:hypothetical protein
MDEWRFLVGTWRGSAKDQFGETGVVETTVVFTEEPGKQFLTSRGEAKCEGRLLNRSLGVMFYDVIAGLFRRKTFFSYGFVNNEVECERRPGELRFDITMEPVPRQFEGMRWRSFLRKIDDTHIAVGLEVARGKGPFEIYGETVLERQPD